MISWEALGLERVGSFRKQLFKFERGVTTIYGVTRDNTASTKNSNGSGKSMFFSSMRETLFEAPIIGEKSDRIRIGTRSVFLKTGAGDKRHRLAVKRVGAKTRVFVDGVDKELRTIPIARQWLASNLPITAEEFDTYVYLDSQSPHPLVRGTSADRKRFFSSFFRLDKMDAEKKLIKAELDKLKQARVLYTELRAQYEKLKPTLVTAEEIAELNKRKKRGQQIMDRLQDTADAAEKARRLIVFYDQSLPQIKHYLHACDASGQEIGVESFDAVLKFIKETMRRNRKALEQAEAYEDHQREVERFRKAMSAMSAFTKTCLSMRGADALDVARKRAAQARKAADRLADIKDKLAELKADATAELPEKVEAPKTERVKIVERLESLEHKLSHAEKFGKGNCPTCGQSVKIDDPKEIEAQIAKLERMIDQHTAARRYNEAASKRKEARTKYTELKEEAATAAATVEKYEKYIETVNQLENAPEPPAKYDGPKLDRKSLQVMVDEDRERLQALDFLSVHVETLVEVLSIDIDKVRESLKESDGLVKQVSSTQTKLAQIEAKLELADQNKEAAASMVKRLKELKDDLADEEDLKLLMEGYDDKAMKRMAVQAISARLMKQVNKYARLVFPEDFTFTFKWDKSDVQLLVHRRYPDRVDTSDVRKLSGAESKLFTLVLVLSLLTFVPSERRSDLLIMDEPTANFGETHQQSFVDMLPVLNAVIPKIIIITPRTSDRFGGKEYTVSKHNGTASIVKGHPTQLGHNNDSAANEPEHRRSRRAA